MSTNDTFDDATIGEQLEEACTCAHAGKCEACIDVAMMMAESAHG